MTAQTQPAQPEAIRLANWIDSNFDPDDMAEFGFDEIATELRRLHAENEQLRDHLQFVERWAVHHGTKPCVSAKEALGVIQHYPPIRRITDGYADGKRPDTFDPYARIAELEETLRQPSREQINVWLEPHGLRVIDPKTLAAMQAELAQLRESKPLSDEQIDEALSNIDEVARNVDHYDFGLPLYSDEVREQLRKAFRDGIGEKTP